MLINIDTNIHTNIINHITVCYAFTAKLYTDFNESSVICHRGTLAIDDEHRLLLNAITDIDET